MIYVANIHLYIYYFNCKTDLLLVSYDFAGECMIDYGLMELLHLFILDCI